MVMPGETYTLQVRGYGATPLRDEVGEFIEQWVDTHTLTGVIQSSSEHRDIPRGEEEIPLYNGYFSPDFTINFDDLSKYRIKHHIPTTPSQEIYYQILEINRNLRLKNNRHHYKFVLGVNRKW